MNLMSNFWGIKASLTLLIICAINTLSAQDVQFTAQAPSQVSIGDRFRLVYTVNQEATDLKIDNLKGFDILSGPNRSSSTSVQIINGKMSQSIKLSFTYLLQAQKEGTFKLPPAKVTVDGKTYLSNSVVIKVIEGTPNAGSSGRNRKSSGSEVSNDDLFLRMLVSRRKALQGEPIIATLKLYTRVNLANLGNFKSPAFNGFWSEILKKAEQINLQREQINGQTFNTAVIQQHVIIPERSGKLTIEPAELTALVRVRAAQQSGFFSRYQNVEKQLTSAEVTIDVSPLPARAPAGFSGAVGDIKVNATLEPQETKTNEAVSLKITFSGTGNLKLIEQPYIKFPPDFEVYDPKIGANYRPGARGYSGSKTFEYLLIPRHEGAFEIPQLNFSYFDLNDKTYKTAAVGPFPLNVQKGEGNADNTGIDFGTMKEDVREVGSDIRFIRTNTFALQPKDRPFFDSFSFYALYLLGILAFGSLLFFLNRRKQRQSDLVYMKNKKAGRLAQNKLKTAKQKLDQGDEKAFYSETVTALWGYLSDKLNIQQKELSKNKVKESLARYQVEGTLIQSYIDLIDRCEFAQFAPGAATGTMTDVYNDAVELINQVERSFS